MISSDMYTEEKRSAFLNRQFKSTELTLNVIAVSVIQEL